MNLKRASENTYVKKSRSDRTNYQRKLLIYAGILVFILSIAISIVAAHSYRRFSTFRNDYQQEVAAYNMQVDQYNQIVDEYATLVQGLISRKCLTNYLSFEKKEFLEDDFDIYRTTNTDVGSILQMKEMILPELDRVTAECSELRVSAINNCIRRYNEEVDKLNALIDRLEGYNAITLPEKERKKNLLTTESPTWSGNADFFADLDIEMVESDKILSEYYEVSRIAYNDLVEDYNILAREYNVRVESTAIEYVTGLCKTAKEKQICSEDEIRTMDEDYLCNQIEIILADTENLIENYLVVVQITNPPEAFVEERLKLVEGIMGVGAVSYDNDPNGLLGKEGGYSACLYFTYKSVDQNSVKGKTIVDKGTDAGGAVEVYTSLESALARCDYLSQFDGTLLYSGSYTIIGTMVIRTSYKLTNIEQVDLTNAIIMKLTEVSIER